MPEPSRDDVLAAIEDAREKRKNRRVHVRKQMEAQYPELVGKRIKRGAETYDAIDYLMSDLESYG